MYVNEIKDQINDVIIITNINSLICKFKKLSNKKLWKIIMIILADKWLSLSEETNTYLMLNTK